MPEGVPWLQSQSCRIRQNQTGPDGWLHRQNLSWLLLLDRAQLVQSALRGRDRGARDPLSFGRRARAADRAAEDVGKGEVNDSIVGPGAWFLFGILLKFF